MCICQLISMLAKRPHGRLLPLPNLEGPRIAVIEISGPIGAGRGPEWCAIGPRQTPASAPSSLNRFPELIGVRRHPPGAGAALIKEAVPSLNDDRRPSGGY
jgi:hypothetical protein